MNEWPELLIARGNEARRRGLPDEAMRCSARAFAAAGDADARNARAQSLIGMGRIERDRGRLDAALARYDEAILLLRAAHDELAVAHAVRHTGDILRELGDAPRALERCVEALEIYRTHSNAPALDVANALRGRGLTQEILGDAISALAAWHEARGLYDAVGVLEGVAEADASVRRLEPAAEPGDRT